MTATTDRTAVLEQIILKHEVTEFLSAESALLDAGDHDSWIGLLTEDIKYTVPVRNTRYSRLSEEFSTKSFVFNDSHYGLRKRAERLHSRFAWAEDPASRNRHFITNITATEDEEGIHARSNVLLYRSRLDDVVSEWMTGERVDLIRRTPDGLRLARRVVYLDQTVLTVSAVTTFL